ncbi:transposase [Acidomonas methanolica]|uniref:transposase n=1 Tax=Acidomonas methanolica TaxID=437 RepID=UPI00351CD589
MAAHDRQHGRSGSQPGGWRKRGTHKEGFGRRCGGFTSKVHARVDGQGRPLGFDLTRGDVSDYSGVDALMDLPVATPRRLLADNGYDRDRIRETLLFRGILPVIRKREPVPALGCSKRIASVHTAAFLVFFAGATWAGLVSPDLCRLGWCVREVVHGI